MREGGPADGLARVPRILCVGAYERDNFGDLLFQLITAQYLDGADVVFAAPFSSDMTELIGIHVPAYGPLLESERFDAVWTVGGEVGGVGIDYAYRTKHGDDAHRDFVAKTPDERRAILAAEQGAVPVESPYLPRASAYAPNVNAAVVVNSVGLAGVRGLPPVRKAGVLGVLREATRIAVRDQRSSEALRDEGIEHRLEPDLVHSIAVTRPLPDRVRGDYVLLQASAAHVRGYGVDGFARAIIDSPVLREHPVRLFTAGTAPGHDSFEVYERVRDLVREADPARRIEISRTTDPWARVDEIASAKLWIGSSLHGRIISCAYGVPRVSFARPKVDDYARTWDDEMPWGIDHGGMDAAASRALELPADDRGADLGKRAHENALSAVEHVREWAASGPPPDRAEAIIGVRNEQWSRLTIELARADAARKAAQAPAPAAKPALTAKPGLARRLRRRAGRVVRRVRALLRSG
ncbi:MAG: polysaccharide pyruvyl transferase family protein [Microbacterium sp.]|uniref:polysaccharide pyruvyl transferase family protein n=1 Tax=Microbacterium sp. TaxID=51671 RepID=UPI0039E42B3E